MIANICKYCPKPLHSNSNTVQSGNNRECGVICGPECVLLYSRLRHFLKFCYVYDLYETSSLIYHLQSHQETYVQVLFQFPHHLNDSDQEKRNTIL